MAIVSSFHALEMKIERMTLMNSGERRVIMEEKAFVLLWCSLVMSVSNSLPLAYV